jgi:hypothetical protein
MKKSTHAIIVFGLMIILMISGCSSNNPVSTGQPDATVVSTASSSSDDAATMRAIILDKLQGHHSIDIVLSAQHTREEWNTTLDRMIARGAPINEEEKQVIIDWLVSRNK